MFSVRTPACLCEGVCRRRSEAMLPSRYVRGKLVPVLTPVTTEVALKGVSEAMAAHVNGVHDVVQEENATVFAPVRPHLLPICRHHLEALGCHLHARPDGLVLPLLLLLHQREHAVPDPRGDVVGQVDEVGGSPARAILIVALCVRGVLATVAGRAVLLAGGRLGVGEQQQVLSCAVFGRQASPRMAVGHWLVEGKHGAEAHIRRGGRGGLNQRPERLGPQIADGIVDGLVDDVGLNQLTCSSVIGEV